MLGAWKSCLCSHLWSPASGSPFNIPLSGCRWSSLTPVVNSQFLHFWLHQPASLSDSLPGLAFWERASYFPFWKGLSPPLFFSLLIPTSFPGSHSIGGSHVYLCPQTSLLSSTPDISTVRQPSQNPTVSEPYRGSLQGWGSKQSSAAALFPAPSHYPGLSASALALEGLPSAQQLGHPCPMWVRWERRKGWMLNKRLLDSWQRVLSIDYRGWAVPASLADALGV